VFLVYLVCLGFFFWGGGVSLSGFNFNFNFVRFLSSCRKNMHLFVGLLPTFPYVSSKSLLSFLPFVVKGSLWHFILLRFLLLMHVFCLAW